MKLLLQDGADVNVPDIKAQTPLTMAVKNRHINCVHALLVAGANPNGDARSLCSPLYIAAMNGFKEILEVIRLFDHRNKIKMSVICNTFAQYNLCDFCLTKTFFNYFISIDA